MVHQVDRRSRQLRHSQHNDLEGLGRLMYVAWAPAHGRPSVTAFVLTRTPPQGSCERKVPAYVKYFLRYLSRQVSQSRHYDCATVLHPWERHLWWAPELDEEGRLDVQVVQPRDHASRVAVVFERGEKPARVISTIEALVVLMGVETVLHRRRTKLTYTVIH